MVARVRAEQGRAQIRTRSLDTQQLVIDARERAYQELTHATQQRLDAYSTVVRRLRGVTVDERTLALSEPTRSPRLSQSTLQDIVRTQIAKDAAFDAVASITSRVASPAVAAQVTRLSNRVSAAATTFVLFAQHADSYTAERYHAVVLRWVKDGHAVEMALIAFQDAAIDGTSR